MTRHEDTGSRTPEDAAGHERWRQTGDKGTPRSAYAKRDMGEEIDQDDLDEREPSEWHERAGRTSRRRVDR